LKSKRRYEIIKGCKNFKCNIINNLLNYKEDLFTVAIAAFSEYPERYRPKIYRNSFNNSLKLWEADPKIDFILCKNNNDIICGYAVIEKMKNCANFLVSKTNPIYEKQGINASIIKFVIDTYLPKYYICDGERPIRHLSNYQEYLCKYFQFRRAYCKLHIRYKTWLKYTILFLFPMRSFFQKLSQLSNSKLFFNISSIMEQERIRRTFI
jgi:hypothetical protein